MTELHKATVKEFKGIQPLEYFRHHIENGSRPDGRSNLTELRPVSISQGTIGSADGSAIVKQGQTIVVCGLKLELAPPHANDPDQGFMVPNVDFPPLCHPQFKPGPPPEPAQVASKFIHEVLTNSGIVDLKDLCIQESKYSWVLHMDLMCLNHDGNVLDCALKALVAALNDLGLPQVTIVEDEDAVVDAGAKVEVNTAQRSKLTLRSKPIACTMAIFEDQIMVDPTEEEESLAHAVVTVVLDAATGDLVHFHKPGGAALSRHKLQECTALAKKHYKTIAKLIDKAGSVSKMSSRKP
eukprot:maker-scaffold552_size138156-snap-gene-0.29 protein:Tk00647 transcript:maker-scaffold552_size138156-snap-gene-0.29-mRNA-1 annotation:"exosome complex component rrp43"